MVRGSNAGGCQIFRIRPERPWDPPSLLCSRYRVSFPGIKRPGRGVKQSYLAPRLKKEYSCASASRVIPCGLFQDELYEYCMWCVVGTSGGWSSRRPKSTPGCSAEQKYVMCNYLRSWFFWDVARRRLVVKLPTVRDRLSVPSGFLGLLVAWRWDPMYRNVGNYQYTLCNIPEEQKPYLHRGGNLKSCKDFLRIQYYIQSQDFSNCT